VSRDVNVEDRPKVYAGAVTWWLADPDHAFTGVRLVQEIGLPADRLVFAAVPGGWSLRLPRPPVRRMEYRLALRHRDGRREEVCAPGNPRRARGAFGDKSVAELPGYAPPAWLAAPTVEGGYVELSVPARGLPVDVGVRLWSPVEVAATEPLPLLVVHDGPEYDRLAAVTTFAAAMIRSGQVPVHRVALVAPGDRNAWYSANVRYAQALAGAVLPAIRTAAGVSGPVIGMGVSLGALAMLHAQRRHRGLLGGLFLQSGSFFDPALDPQERGFSGFTPVTRFVGRVLRGTAPGDPVPTTLTCGTAEENLDNNRQLASALRSQGYDVRLVEVPDAHNYVAWRDALHPALTDLLGAVWD